MTTNNKVQNNTGKTVTANFSQDIEALNNKLNLTEEQSNDYQEYLDNKLDEALKSNVSLVYKTDNYNHSIDSKIIDRLVIDTIYSKALPQYRVIIKGNTVTHRLGKSNGILGNLYLLNVKSKINDQQQLIGVMLQDGCLFYDDIDTYLYRQNYGTNNLDTLKSEINNQWCLDTLYTKQQSKIESDNLKEAVREEARLNLLKDDPTIKVISSKNRVARF